MRVAATALDGVVVVDPEVRSDSRGHFFEAWHADRYSAVGLPGEFSQCNVSVSSLGVLRGLHLQYPPGQAKLITAVRGAIFDVAVDVRRGSPSFGRWFGTTLTGENAHQLFVPAGYAHGFLSLADHTVVMYLTTVTYDPSSEVVIRWDDPTIAIAWPDTPRQLSARDAAAPFLAELGGRLPPLQA